MSYGYRIYAITYQYSTSVNYLCLPLRLNTADARASRFRADATAEVVRVERHSAGT